MAFYMVDLHERIIQRVTGKYVGADNERYFLIEAGSKKMAWAMAMRKTDAVDRNECDSCGHPFCRLCDECSLSQRYSDYWICHSCGALSPRNRGLH
jgi:hypothetical protein